MSGIAGIIRFNGEPVDVTALNSMAEKLALRGPDRVNIWHRESVGMVHTMLCTTPESLNEILPLVDNEAGLILTADARIDNRDELSNQLGITKEVLYDLSDSEMILMAYKKWGEDCPVKIVGDFAFGIWNCRTRTLFCARDHMGVKPFYYYRCHDFIVFASEIKALFCLPEVPRELNNERVADYLFFVYSDTESTFFEEIYSLPNAGRMAVNHQAVKVSRYFRFDAANILHLKSNGEYAEAFRDIFEKVVSSHLRSAYPVGSTLSGGMDSSSIVCMARKTLENSGKGALHTFSAIFPNLPSEQFKRVDERIYMDAVIEQDGVVPHFVRADHTGPFTDMDAALERFEEPVLAINRYIHVAMYKKAKEKGVRVFLDGIDGDTTVSHGYEKLSELGHCGRILSLLSESRALALRSGKPFSARRTLYSYCIKPRIPTVVIERIRAWLGRKPEVDTTLSRLSEHFRNMNRAEREIKILGYLPDLYVNARQRHAQGLSHPIYPSVMNMIDIDSSSYGLEARYPFWDRRLMTFCLALPSDQKLHSGWTRAVLHRSMKGILPDLVQNRADKSDLSPNVALKLSEFNPERVKELLFSKTSPINHLINVTEVSRQWDAFVKKPFENSGLLIDLYTLITLALWLEHSRLVFREK